MARVSKNPEERRNELLDAAEELFNTIGYNKAAVSDIVKKISVAQGTFYYYFKSKEEIFVAIFYRNMEEFIKEFDERINKTGSSALDKLKEFIRFDIQNKINNMEKALVDHLHDEVNEGLHLKVIKATIQNYKPVLLNIINLGVKDGEFRTEYPEEISELYLTTLNFILDPGIFKFTKEEYKRKTIALMDTLEKTLALPEGSLNMNGLLIQ